MRYKISFPALLMCCESAAYLSNDMYLSALPTVMRDLSTNHTWAQLTLTALLLGATSMHLLLGPLSDRYGRRPILLTGGVLFILGNFICALTSNLPTFLFARFLQGVTISSVVIPGYATIHELFDHRRSMQIIAWMSSITICAPAFGPLLGGLIIHATNWRFIFILLGCAAVVIWSLLYIHMPETCPPEKRSVRPPSQIIRSYKHIMTTPRFMLNTIIFCALFVSVIAWIAMGPFLVIDVFKKSPIVFGNIQILVFGSLIVSMQSLRRLVYKFEPQQLVYVGLRILLLSSIVMIGIALESPHNLWLFVAVLMLFAGSSAMVTVPVQRFVVEASQESMGIKMALFNFHIDLSGVLITSLMSLLYNETLWMIAALLLTLTLLAYGAYTLLQKTGRA